MILNHMLLEDEYPDTIISLCNVPLQNSTEFKYIGLYISQNEHKTGDIEINHRSRWHTQNLLSLRSSFNILRFTLKSEQSF